MARGRVLLILVFVITGSINTLSTKWADRLESESSDGQVRHFNHPFFQALGMFIGETLCLITYKILFYYYKRQGDDVVQTKPLVKGNTDFNPFIFFIPALCDMCGTSLMYVGLTMTYASSFQMLRGSIIVFVALLSVGFLQRKINSREWVGIFLVIIGLTIVGLSDFYFSSSNENKDVNSIITGDLLIIMAQVILSFQMVYEEYFINNKDIAPLQAVGWEGVFGFLVLALLQIPFYFIIVGHPLSGNPRGSLEDFYDAIVQLRNNHLLIFALLGTILSIAFYNFAGISVTKEISATTRTVLDSLRTVVIWVFSLALSWQAFSYIQIIGFIFLLGGMFIYNDVYVTTSVRWVATKWEERRAPRQEILINQNADETEP